MSFEPATPLSCLIAIRRILLVAMAMVSLQYLVNSRAFSARGLLSWNILKDVYRSKVIQYSAWNLLFNQRGFVCLNLALLGCSVFALLPANPSPLAVSGLFGLHCLIYLRSFVCLTGSDQLNTLVLFHLLLCSFIPAPGFVSLTLCSLGVQTIFVYLCSGALKLREPGWHDGSCVREVLCTESFGHPAAARFFTSLPIYVQQLFSRFIVFWELGFGLTPFLPQYLLFVYLGVGVIFHLANALFMGLNGFLFSFLSTYPAIWFLNSWINHRYF